MMPKLLSIVLIIACLWGCTADEGTPVPRRKAFPRVAVPDTVFTPVDGLPVHMRANAGQRAHTDARADGSFWLTVEYPAYGARILCTFTPVDESTVAGVLDNRYERMSLNAGAGAISIDEFDNPGAYHSSILRSQAVPATPVQFISLRPERPRWVVSGSVFFENASPTTSADSVRPMVYIMHGEVTRMLRSLRDQLNN